MQAHLVLPLLLGDQGPKGQCPRAGTQVMGVDTARGHPSGKCAELGSIQDSPSTRTHGKRKTQPGAGSRELSVSVPDVSLTRTADLSTDMSPRHPHRHSIAATPPLRQSLGLVYLLVRVPKPQPPARELPHVRPLGWFTSTSAVSDGTSADGWRTESGEGAPKARGLCFEDIWKLWRG